ncbi:hypothetical protein F5I97DRAFT_1826568 [Phlebopus sp. FC_14]|nr:hypothetical protein F5I97DRAFT_1826568 [Phlebopus sp. FC_14]
MPCHVKKAQSLFPTLTPVIHTFAIQELLGHAEKENPATFGIFTIDGGNPTSYNKLPFHGFVVVTEGQGFVEDLDKPGQSTTMEVGDILHVHPGTSFRWGSTTKCKGFYVHLKALGDPVFVNGLY